jgi:Cu(I)/Ag(I) efflux system periplasmic protein CusF
MAKSLFIVAGLLLCGFATAQTNVPADHSTHHPSPGVSEGAASDFSTAEVRKVDRDAQKVTLRHSAIPHLGMPDNMTMVFRVTDPKMLEGLKAGDKIRFKAAKVGGQYTVTELDLAK